MAGLKHRLVGRDNYLAYAVLRQAHRLAGWLRRPAAAPEPVPSVAGPAPLADSPADRDALAGRGTR